MASVIVRTRSFYPGRFQADFSTPLNVKKPANGVNWVRIEFRVRVGLGLGLVGVLVYLEIGVWKCAGAKSGRDVLVLATSLTT